VSDVGADDICEVCEIFSSIQGESTHAGRPCAFVRLAGCPFDCNWCDTGYARLPGQPMRVAQILAIVESLGIPLVEVTGGEPLAQEGVYPLLEALVARDGEVLLETSGLVATDRVPRGVRTILDLKAPSSGQSHSIVWENLERLRPGDEVKFVVADRGDYTWMREVLGSRPELGERAVLVSPAAGLLEPARLAEWILADRLPVRLNLQLHRILWPDRDRGV
jgi:7-carboxy-7-deazaguanine synthase